jgi:hypothetical protein
MVAARFSIEIKPTSTNGIPRIKRNHATRVLVAEQKLGSEHI